MAATDRRIPTLFRHPGAEALQALLEGRLRRLAPVESPVLWLHERPAAARPGASRAFGVVAVLEPARLSPRRVGRGVWQAANRPTRLAGETLWAPPSALQRPLAWNRLKTAEAARRRFGRGYEEERLQVLESLAAYLEELSLLARSGVSLATPWCEQSRAQRRRILARHAIPGRWTR